MEVLETATRQQPLRMELPTAASYEKRVAQETSCAPIQSRPWPANAGLQVREGLFILRKEVIQPQVPLRLPCYDLVPITRLAFGVALLAVRQTTSGAPNFRGLTGGVYKARERIHRGMLIRDY